MTAEEFTPYVFMQRLRDNRGLPSRTKLVAYALVSYAQPGVNVVFPSVQTLADVTGLSVDTVKAALKDLDNAGVAKPLKQRRGSMARALFYPRHNAWAPRGNSRHRPKERKVGESFIHEAGESLTRKVITKNVSNADQSAAKRSAALAPPARGGSHRRAISEPQPKPLNTEFIMEFVSISLTWEEWMEGDDSLPLERPTGNGPGDQYMRRRWDAEHQEWVEAQREAEARIAVETAACDFGCAATDGRFVHTDGTHWYCDHTAPWPEQVEWYRKTYPECRREAVVEAQK